LYGWHVKARLNQQRSEVEPKLAVENARLKRQLSTFRGMAFTVGEDDSRIRLLVRSGANA